MRKRFLHLLLALMMTAVIAACDKGAEAPANAPSAGTSGTTGADSVEDLLAKLPEDSKPAGKAAESPNVQVFGKFGTNAALPTGDGERTVEVDPRAVAELNIVAQFRVESAFAERVVGAKDSVLFQFGGAEADDGLLVTARYKGRAASAKVVPADSGPELVSNFDHTVDRVLDELGVPRRR